MDPAAAAGVSEGDGGRRGRALRGTAFLQRAAAQRDHQAAVLAGGVSEGGGGRRARDLRRAALLQRAAAQRDHQAATAAFQADLAAARAAAERNCSLREELKGYKRQLLDVQSQLREALSVKLRMESKYKLIVEMISTKAATTEKLNSMVLGLRNKRDRYSRIISEQLQELEALEAECNKDAGLIEAALSWYEKLGIKLVVAKGVKFVFNQIDLQCPEKEYSVCIYVDKGGPKLLQCDPQIKDMEELVKDLNSNDICKFLRTARETFQGSTLNAVSPDVPCVPVSSPVTTVVDQSGSQSEVPNQSGSQSKKTTKKKKQFLPAKRHAAALSVASPGSAASSLRRSPRLMSPCRGRIELSNEANSHLDKLILSLGGW
ncbi:hypothetical protein ACP4OV_015942 [Aristida adscensionis]